METRIIVAYALCAVLIFAGIFAVSRYLKKQREFKIRQMGRGKNINVGLDSSE
jgi:hypothetical protein